MSILNNFRQKVFREPSLAVKEKPAAGVYHFKKENEEGKTRIHLRLEGDGSGVLLVNASRLYHLNPTAASMAYLALNETPQEDSLKSIRNWYRVSAKNALADYQEFCQQLEIMTNPDEHCSVCELDMETLAPFSSRPSAPYRMDLALTYRCNNNCAHCYNARPRLGPELSAGQWKNILDKLWDLGVPHIVFTGGEPTLRPDLPELIAHAERNGQITGINTNGRKMQDPQFVQSLVDAGLDHVQITLESHDAAIHDRMVRAKGAWQMTVAGVKNALASRLFVMTNTTLLRYNAPYLAETLEFLADLGLPTIGMNALIYSGRGLEVSTGLAEAELPPLLTLAREATQRHDQKLIWYTPTQYCHFDPMQLELGVKGCTAAQYNMCTEPDGAVLPCQSYYQPLGNILMDPWSKIWNHELAVALRERKNLPIDCMACSMLLECGGGCPLARMANPDLKPKPIYDSVDGICARAEREGV